TEHTPQDVTDYLEKLGRIGRMAEWQYGQTVDARQNLLLMGEATWARQFAWAYWKLSARTLPVTHPTIAREAATVTRRAQIPRTDRVPLARVRETHAPLLDALMVLDSGVFDCLTLVDTENAPRREDNHAIRRPPGKRSPAECVHVHSGGDAPHRPANASVPSRGLG